MMWDGAKPGIYSIVQRFIYICEITEGRLAFATTLSHLPTNEKEENSN